MDEEKPKKKGGYRNPKKGHGFRFEAVTEEEKAIERAVLEAIPPEYRDKKRRRPLYTYNPNKVKGAYARILKDKAAGKPFHIPPEVRLKGARASSRKGIPSGESRTSWEAKKQAMLEKLMRERMTELEEQLGTQLELTPILPVDVQRETGIAINPAYQLQKLWATEDLTVKEKLDTLKLLMEYTHKKAATRTEVTVSRPEAFLEQIAHMEGEVIDGEIVSDSEASQG